MNWDNTGKEVSGIYIGQFPFTGIVQSSRVKYGGKVSNTIKVYQPFEVYGEIREVVLVDSDELEIK